VPADARPRQPFRTGVPHRRTSRYALLITKPNGHRATDGLAGLVEALELASAKDTSHALPATPDSIPARAGASGIDETSRADCRAWSRSAR
jgi:hypothetical protein